jgi:hypothetical protein
LLFYDDYYIATVCLQIVSNQCCLFELIESFEAIVNTALQLQSSIDNDSALSFATDFRLIENKHRNDDDDDSDDSDDDELVGNSAFLSIIDTIKSDGIERPTITVIGKIQQMTNI